MTTAFDAKTYVRDLERAWNDKDAAGFVAKHYDANVEFHDPKGGATKRGAQELRGVMEAWFEAFSEMRIQPVQVIAEGSDVAILQRCAGRHTGELELSPGERIPATQKSATVDVSQFLKLNAQGKIVRDATILDNARILMQLGLMPSSTKGGEAQRAVKR